MRHARRIDLEHADLGGHDDQVILGDIIAGGTQTVAIEDSTDLGAVGKRDRGGTVPRFHQATVILVERPFLVAHRLVVFPRFRDHHHHRVRQGSPGQHQELETVVEHGRVAAQLVDNRGDFLDIGAKQIRLEHGLAGVHPVDVAAQGIDLAVMGDVAVGMRAGPVGERVGAEPGMDQGQGAGHGRVEQFRVKGRYLFRQEHTLVHDGPMRQAGDVEIIVAGHLGVTDLVHRPFPDDV